ncbi:MAG: hypothetical protein AB1405_15985, partial [Bdellovibrionota bacterium]
LARQPETQQALKDLKHNLVRLDLDRIFEGSPPFFQNPNGERVFRIVGALRNGRYELATGDVPFEAPGSPRMGDVGAEIALSRNPILPDLVRVRTEGMVHLGPLLHRELLESWEVFHHVLASRRAKDDQRWLGRVRLPPKAAGPGMELDDMEILSEWAGTFPAVADKVAGFLTVEDILGKSRSNEGGPVPVHLAAHVDRDALGDLYPEDFQDLRLFVDRVSFSTDVLLENGARLARFSYSGEDHRVETSFLLQDGGFAVFDAAGYPLGEVVYPTKVSELSYNVVTNLVFNFYGLKIFMDGIKLKCHFIGPPDWEAPSRLAVFSVEFNEPPRVKAEGALFYVLPKGFLDVFIPGTIESLLDTFFRQFTSANRGRGFMTELKFEEFSGEHRLSGLLSFEIPYRILAPLVQDIIQREWADTAGRSESRPKRLLADLRKAVREDFAKIDPRPRTPEPPGPRFIP